jgi:hypothetical protein
MLQHKIDKIKTGGRQHMPVIYIAIDHILSVTYDTRSGPTESRSTIADDDYDLYNSHTPDLYT